MKKIPAVILVDRAMIYDIAKLKKELKFLRWSLLTAVICVLLLGAVIVMLNLRASNETETVVLSLQADVSALQEAHTDTIAMLKKEAAAMEEE